MDSFWEAFTAVLLSTVGGLAKLLHQKDKKAFRVFNVISHIFVSGFTGLMMVFALRAFKVEGDYIGLFCGLAGWAGPAVLDALTNLTKKIGIDLSAPAMRDDEKKEEKKEAKK